MQTITNKRTVRTGAAGLAIGLVLLALSGCPNVFTALGGSGSGGGGGGGGSTPAPTKRISLSKSGIYDFPIPNEADRTVTVTNTGREATGALTVALSGADAGSFILDNASAGASITLNDIAVGGTATFTVNPAGNMVAPRFYTARVTVSGSDIRSVPFGLSYKLSLNPITNPDGFIAYLNTLSDGATVPFDDGNLGKSTDTLEGWLDVNRIIGTDVRFSPRKHLILDLTNCILNNDTTITGTASVPDPLPPIGQDNANKFNIIQRNEYIIGIILPSVLTSIGENACKGCIYLTSVTIPAGVTSIGDNAFNGCTGLTSMDIPANVATIGDNTFDGCKGLTSVTFVSDACAIGDNAFPEGSSGTGGDALKTAYTGGGAGTYIRSSNTDSDWHKQ